jgi:acyl-CoA thioesterase-2
LQEPVIPQDPVADLADVLNLTSVSDTEFIGRTQWMPHGRVFGGQVLAQSMVAAMKTVEANRPIHSLHSYFLRPGDIHQEISFDVELLRDGKSFSARRVKALQEDKPIFVLSASFQEPAAGLEHQEEMPAGLPEPESLPSARELLAAYDQPATNYWSKARPFDLRHIEEPIYLKPASAKANSQMIWFKTVSAFQGDAVLQTAALAYASDYTLLESVLRNHGVSWAEPGLNVASLDHAMWFHSQPDVNDWMLYVQRSPAATSGRGLAQGSIFARDGRLLANIAQEGMVRVPKFR